MDLNDDVSDLSFSSFFDGFGLGVEACVQKPALALIEYEIEKHLRWTLALASLPWFHV